MLAGAKDVAKNILLVMKKPSYLLLAAVLSLFIFAIFILLNNISLFVSAFEISKDLATMAEVFLNAVDMIADIGGITNFLAVVVASVLAGISITMIVYQITATRKLGTGQGLLNFGGVFGGALASSCAACSSALISILGVAGGLAIFPLRGLEISSLSIVILLASIFFVSKGISKNGCKMEVGK